MIGLFGLGLAMAAGGVLLRLIGWRSKSSGSIGLREPEELAQRIEAELRSATDWQARVRCVEELAAMKHPASREPLLRALDDEHEAVRLAAATGLGPTHARSTLLEIASRESSSDAAAAASIRVLGEALDTAAARTLLERAHAAGAELTTMACLRRLAAAHRPDLVEPMARALAFGSDELRVQAARALAASGVAAAEAPLRRALLHGPLAVRIAAADALGVVGSSDAVLPLLELAVPATDPALSLAARRAAGQIQSRLHGATPGQLSLANGGAGALSLAAENPAGQVSLADAAHDTGRRPRTAR